MEEDNPLLGYIIFIILNLIIAGLVIVFVVRAAENASFYEKAYAEQIALAVDNAKPGTTLFLDMKKGAEISKKFQTEPRLTVEKNKITVKISDKGPGSSESFFKLLSVKAEYLPGNQQIQLTITEKSKTM